MKSIHFHEDLSRQSFEETPTEKALGVTFAAVFFTIGIAQLYVGHDWPIATFAIGTIFLLLAYFWLAPLRPLNKLWHRFGLILFHVVNPVVMGIVFFLTILPIGLLMRAFGKDPLRLKLDRNAQSYWQERAASGDIPQSMKNQF